MVKQYNASIDHQQLTWHVDDTLQGNRWQSAAYAFFEERLKIVRKLNRAGVLTTYHEFECAKCHWHTLCGTGTDSGSTGALTDHISNCWGDEIWSHTKGMKAKAAKEIVEKCKKNKNAKLTDMFSRVPGSKETFSLAPPSWESVR